MPETEIPEIKLRLYSNPELAAEKLYEFLRTQSFEVRKNLQMIIDDLPLTKSFKEDYSMNDSGD